MKCNMTNGKTVGEMYTNRPGAQDVYSCEKGQKV